MRPPLRCPPARPWSARSRQNYLHRLLTYRVDGGEPFGEARHPAVWADPNSQAAAAMHALPLARACGHYDSSGRDNAIRGGENLADFKASDFGAHGSWATFFSARAMPVFPHCVFCRGVAGRHRQHERSYIVPDACHCDRGYLHIGDNRDDVSLGVVALRVIVAIEHNTHVSSMPENNADQVRL